MHFSKRPYLIVVLLLLAAFLLNVGVGPVFISPATFVRMLLSRFPGVSLNADWPATFNTIVFGIRLPHAILIALTGAALSGSGAAYQGLFRNPLADPYLIGVASGAGLGAVLAMSVQWPSTWLGFSTIPLAAFTGATVTVLFVYGLARQGFGLPTTTIILAGVAMSSFMNALTSFLLLSTKEEMHQAMTWLLGGSLMSGWEPVTTVLPYLATGIVLLLGSGHVLNVMQFGDEQALQLGLHVERAKLWVIAAATLTTSAAVAFSGVIGFIGLIVPHILRILCGPDYRHLIPLSLLGGSSALLVADMLSRVVLAPQVLPVGVVTALAGAPFFIWILRRARSKVFW